MSEEGSRQSVKSLLKMLDVLESFSAVDRELSVVEIAGRTGLPRTTVHRLVDSLRALGFVEQEASRDRYRLGLKLFELGNTALTNLPLYREAPSFVDTLSKLSGEAVHLCVFDGAHMVFITRSEQGGGPHNTLITMVATPCHSTGVGKAALAYQGEAVINRILRAGLPRFTANTIVDLDRMKDELAAIRERGYAIDDCEHEADLRCIGAPIRNAHGRVFAAISVTGRTRRITPSRVPELARLVVSHAEQISVRLGYRPQPSTGLDKARRRVRGEDARLA